MINPTGFLLIVVLAILAATEFRIGHIGHALFASAVVSFLLVVALCGESAL